MKLVLFQQTDTGPQLPGLLTERGVVDISGVVRSSYTPQMVMEGIIDDFDKLRPRLQDMAQTTAALPLASVRTNPAFLRRLTNLRVGSSLTTRVV